MPAFLKNYYEKIPTRQPSTWRGQLCFRVTLFQVTLFKAIQSNTIQSNTIPPKYRFATQKVLIWHWRCISQWNVTDKNQLLSDCPYA